MREVGILVLVFGPLDAVLKAEASTAKFVTVTVLLGLLFTIVGIIIEGNTYHHAP